MSIVEKALKKAQQSVAIATASAPPPMPEVPPPVTAAAAPDPGLAEAQQDELSITARDLKPIVALSVEDLRSAGRLPPADAAEQVEEEFRRVKWPLLKAITGRGDSAPARNNVILVTSALPGEGKTFTSLNLALSIVRDREMRVILVDGDVARPGLTPSLGLEGRPGLNDVLDDVSLDVNSVTYRTDVEGLFFVPAGKWHEHSPEFFAGSRMPWVIESLSRRVGNGVIVLDSPPLLSTNEAQVVTRYVGQVLLVVQADSTEHRAVQDAIALIDKSVITRAVLNRVEESTVSKYYGQYYYGYGYGRGREAHGGRGKGNA